MSLTTIAIIAGLGVLFGLAIHPLLFGVVDPVDIDPQPAPPHNEFLASVARHAGITNSKAR